MKRHVVAPESVAAALEAGRRGASSGGTGIGGAGIGGTGMVSMVPNIQPYQAAGGGVGGGYYGGADASKSRRRDNWDQTVATGVAVWFGGWLFGYGVLWPLYAVLSVVSSVTPFGGVFDAFWSRGAPLADVYPSASELRIPSGQVSRYVDSYVQNYGDAALVFAAHDGYAQLVSELLSSKDLGYHDLLDAADESGHTALLYAAGRGFAQVAAALLRAGADPDAPRQGQGGGGLTPLMQAAGSGHREVVAYLLQANATADARDLSGNTALMYAAHAGQLGALQELLQRGAMRDLQNVRGDTALSFATANRHQAVVDALQRGARPVVEGRRSRSANLAASEPPRPSLKASAEKRDAPRAAADAEDSGGGVASLLSSLSGGSHDKAAPMVSTAAAEKAKKLEQELQELKRAHEQTELKSQRRIVDLLEQGADKQKVLDDRETENRKLREQVDELTVKARKHELDAEHERSRAEAATAEASRERSRAETVDRERESHATELRFLKEEVDRRKREAAERTAEADRLSALVHSLRAEAGRAEEERGALQRQLSDLRRGAGRSLQEAPAPSPPAPSAPAPPPDIAAAAAPSVSLPPPALEAAAAPALEVGVGSGGALGGAAAPEPREES